MGSARARRAIAGLAFGLVVGGCVSLPVPDPEVVRHGVPIGGEWAAVIPRDLAAARQGMPGGLVEPSWLPDGFELVFVAYAGGMENSTDLHYRDGDHQLHIWQAFRGPGELGPKEPFDYGARTPIGDAVEWHASSLERQLGTVGLVEYRGLMPDGRTVSVDGTLDAETMERILRSLYVRAPAGG